MAAHVVLDAAFAESTLTTRFDEAVGRHADRIAVTDGGAETTYAELAGRVASLAEALTAAGLRPGEPAALLADQGLAAVTGVLAVLRAGGAFAPLDVLDPPARAGRLLELSGARILVASPARAAQARRVASAVGDAGAVVVADGEVASPLRVAAVGATPSSPASVFFTSGSTGAPKAVLDLHRNVLHNTMRYTQLLGLRPADRLSLVQRPSFSGIASSLFGALLNGATLCTYPLSADSVPGLADWVDEQRVTVFHAVPAIFRALVAGGRSFPHVRVVRLEGDRATWREVELFRRHFAEGAVLANGLGTTETGLACQFRVTARTPLGDGVLPVGDPAPGIEVVVLGAEGRPVPPGETGEVGVRSRYLAAGYLGAPDLTAQRFREEGGGVRLYRTGDLGRIDAAGRLEVLGRVDGTLKVAGTRVEPAEVEAALLRVPGVAEAAVSIEAGRGAGGRLEAQVVVRESGPDEHRLRGALQQLLPAAMIPARIRFVERLRVDANWKLDRHRREPDTDLERALRDIWAEVLETDVGLDDTFVSLGGDSLAAAEVSAVVERRLGLEVAPSLLARAPTVARLARAVSALRGEGGVELVVLADGPGPVPLLLVPNARGQALMYGALARAVGPDQAVWALQLSPGRIADPTVPAVAHLGLAALRAAQPHGPYALGGFCYGGLVAIEMARRLRLEGEEVLVTCFALHPGDVPGFVDPAALARWRRRATRTVGLRHAAWHVRHALRLPRGDRQAYLATRGRNLLAWLRRPPWRGDGPLGAAGRRHQAAVLPGALTIVLGAETVALYADDPAAAWAPAADEVDVRVLPGTDDGVLVEPAVWRLGAVLDSLLAAGALGADDVAAQTVP